MRAREAVPDLIARRGARAERRSVTARRVLALVAALAVASCATPPAPAPAGPPVPSPPDNALVNLYDAFGAPRPGLRQDFGFAALVRHRGRTILFDSGSDAAIFAANVAALGVDLTRVDLAVASHAHPDHTSGFDHVFRVSSDLRLHVPHDFHGFGSPLPTDLGGRDPAAADEVPPEERYFGGGPTRVELRTSGRFPFAPVVTVAESRELAPGVWLVFTRAEATGYFSRYPPHEDAPRLTPLPELSLALDTAEGIVLVVGCSHSGVETIVAETRRLLGRPIALVAGGFHLLPYTREEVTALAERLRTVHGVRRVAPAHCSGHLAFAVFRRVFGADYVHAGLGTTIALPE